MTSNSNNTLNPINPIPNIDPVAAQPVATAQVVQNSPMPTEGAPIISQDNSSNGNLPWQSRVSNQMDPLKFTPPVIQSQPAESPIMQNIEPIQTVQTVQPVENIQALPVENNPVIGQIEPSIITPVETSAVQMPQESTRVEVIPEPQLIDTPSNELPGQSLDANSSLTQKIQPVEAITNTGYVDTNIPTTNVEPIIDQMPNIPVQEAVTEEVQMPQINQVPTEKPIEEVKVSSTIVEPTISTPITNVIPTVTEVPKTEPTKIDVVKDTVLPKEDPLEENKRRIRNIMFVVGGLVIAIIVLLSAIYIASNAA